MNAIIAALIPIIEVLVKAIFGEMAKPETAERADYDEADRYIDDDIDATVRAQGL